MMFTIVFGLSMDYEVFLLSRIREEWRRRRVNTMAVADGLASTARVITAAAAIMVCVFGSFVINDPLRVLDVFGLGLATAIFVDATLVRMVPGAVGDATAGAGQLVDPGLAGPDTALARGGGRGAAGGNPRGSIGPVARSGRRRYWGAATMSNSLPSGSVSVAHWKPLSSTSPRWEAPRPRTRLTSACHSAAMN